MNREEMLIGGGDGPGGGQEVAAVSKQTTETLMAGERIMEALDVADADVTAFKEFEDQRARLSPQEAAKLSGPARNPLLAMQDLEPAAYVLKVVEQVHNTALQDALLVLPFGKVISLVRYLDEWARRVRLPGAQIFDGLN
jgi:U3 small nucleolar RNA-associated protein 12